MRPWTSHVLRNVLGRSIRKARRNGSIAATMPRISTTPHGRPALACRFRREQVCETPRVANDCRRIRGEWRADDSARDVGTVRKRPDDQEAPCRRPCEPGRREEHRAATMRLRTMVSAAILRSRANIWVPINRRPRRLFGGGRGGLPAGWVAHALSERTRTGGESIA